MKKIIVCFLAVLLVAISFNAQAQYYNGYYNNSGNTYRKSGNSTYGYNRNTGSTWSSTSYGNVTRGVDKKGNSWSYDHSTGAYYNSNGTVRYGKGNNRRSYKYRY